MNEDVRFILEATEENMQNALLHLEKELVKIRAGKASPSMLSSVMVEYYGNMTPLSQMSNVNTPDARTISVQPWEKQMIPQIETAILNSNLGFNPMNNGEMVIINVPPLTEERRKQLVKQAKVEAEDAKVSIRSARQEANKEVKALEVSEDLVKNAEIDIQDLTDQFSQKVDRILEVKEAEIMKV